MLSSVASENQFPQDFLISRVEFVNRCGPVSPLGQRNQLAAYLDLSVLAVNSFENHNVVLALHDMANFIIASTKQGGPDADWVVKSDVSNFGNAQAIG